MHATLPYLGGAGERRALLGGITFLDVTAEEGLDIDGLSRWFEEHVVAAGCAPRLSVLLEPPAGSLSLNPGPDGRARAARDLPRVLGVARARTVAALRGLIGSPQDDRFLRAAIFLGRVRREGSRWVARPEPTAPLSGIVLSLFAVAVLSERPFYDHNLCVCDTCGRVSFDTRPALRNACPTHAPRLSGVTQKPRSTTLG
jgi:hypothetical protein